MRQYSLTLLRLQIKLFNRLNTFQLLFKILKWKSENNNNVASKIKGKNKNYYFKKMYEYNQLSLCGICNMWNMEYLGRIAACVV